MIYNLSSKKDKVYFKYSIRVVASLTVPGGQEFPFPHFFLKFWSIFLIFPQTLLIFFLISAFRVGESPTREGPGYATVQYSIFQPSRLYYTVFGICGICMQMNCTVLSVM